MFKFSVAALVLVLVAGCSSTGSAPRIWYDRKYNEYRYLRGHVPPFRSELRAAASGSEGQMETVRKEMEAIRDIADRTERRRAMEQHMKAMHADASIMGGCTMHMSTE